MDLISRKYQLIEKLMDVVNPEKIKEVEAILNDTPDLVEEEIIAYTAKGEALTREQYIKNNEEASRLVANGEYSTTEEILAKFRKLADGEEL